MQNITKQKDDFSAWYQDVISVADLAEHSPVRGCMIIKPYGYSIWEKMQTTLDGTFKKRGVENAYFPIFIPENFLKREAEHVKGFSPELAVVTHGGGKKLDEPLIIRPTSETIIYESFSRWIQSYRDLPLLINQWANVVRWEMRPRLFLRTSEFLWQEGHTAHATADEAKDYALSILDEVYKWFAEEVLAIPVYTGVKSEAEKFAGAKQTFCIEALMQDGKSLQMGTAHDLSDNFSRSFDVTFLDQSGERKHAYLSSWGVSTRMIGGLIMSHGDDKGLIIPPRIAPIHVVITPIMRTVEDEAVGEAHKLAKTLSEQFVVKVDDRMNLRAGEKFYEWEKKGVPVRIEIGPKDLKNQSCVLVRRDTGEKQSVALTEVKKVVTDTLEDIQSQLFQRAQERREQSNQKVNDWESFVAAIEQGGYVFAHWCEQNECEKNIKDKTKATTRCLPFEGEEEPGEHKCVLCGGKAPNKKRWIFARSY